MPAPHRAVCCECDVVHEGSCLQDLASRFFSRCMGNHKEANGYQRMLIEQLQRRLNDKVSSIVDVDGVLRCIQQIPDFSDNDENALRNAVVAVFPQTYVPMDMVELQPVTIFPASLPAPPSPPVPLSPLSPVSPVSPAFPSSSASRTSPPSSAFPGSPSEEACVDWIAALEEMKENLELSDPELLQLIENLSRCPICFGVTDSVVPCGPCCGSRIGSCCDKKWPNCINDGSQRRPSFLRNVWDSEEFKKSRRALNQTAMYVGQARSENEELKRTITQQQATIHDLEERLRHSSQVAAHLQRQVAANQSES